jgi:hypothetical protein
MAEALTSIVEENEIREALSPWERGRIAHLAHRQGVFDTIEAAVARLYPAAGRHKRARLRVLAHLVEELDDVLTAPERFSQHACCASPMPSTRVSTTSSAQHWPNARSKTPRPNGNSCCPS